jgi:methylisocitrate lyase
MAQEAGFPAVYLSGAALSAGVLGVADVGLFTLTELVHQVCFLADRLNVPILVDADTGFGGVLQVERTVRRLEAAGAAAIQIEDQELPKRCGHLSGKTLVSCQEMSSKIRAAKNASRDADTILIARTDARAVTGLSDAINRGQAYVAAGADWIFPEALESIEEFAEYGKALGVPLVANMTEFGKSPLLTVEQLSQLGYRVVLYPVTALRAAARTVQNLLASISDEGTQAGLLDAMLTRQELYDLIGYGEYEAQDRRYFGGAG